MSLLLSAGMAEAAPFSCSGEAFVTQNMDAQLYVIDQSTSPFVFVPIGGPAGFQINNLGFRRTDGLLYGWHRNNPVTTDQEVVTIDNTGTVTPLGNGALPQNVFFNAGDVSNDGSTMYLNADGAGALWSVALPGLGAASSVTISGATGSVADWAFNRADSLLYGGDHSDGQVAHVNPATGVRADAAVLGCAPITATCNAASLPSGGLGYGAAWFNAAGNLFLFHNAGTIYEIGDVTTTPIIVSTQTGPASGGFNDGAACVNDVVGAAKQMTSSNLANLPSTVTITYTLEAFTSTVNDLSASDDLTAVFGTHGVDWTFTSISSSVNIEHNAGFNGHSVTELIDQPVGTEESLAIGTTATITVEIELLTLAGDTDMDGFFCNQIALFGTASSVAFGDISTDGTDPDPSGDGSPDERALSCFGAQLPVDLINFSIE